EMRVGMKEHRARTAELAGNAELAFQDVPDLREIVAMPGVVRARREAQEAGIGLGRARRAWVKQHLAGLAGPADRLPFHLVDVADQRRLVRSLACPARLAHRLSPVLARRRGDVAARLADGFRSPAAPIVAGI